MLTAGDRVAFDQVMVGVADEPQAIAACGVIACVGGAIGVLAVIVVMLNAAVAGILQAKA